MINYIKMQAEEISSPAKKIKYKIDNQEVFAEEYAQREYQLQGYKTIWTENNYWWEVMALLFWDIIFARVRGAVMVSSSNLEWFPNPDDEEFLKSFDFCVKENGMPFDFFSLDFYRRRKSMIGNRIRELNNSDLINVLQLSYSHNNNKKCRAIDNWNRYSLNDLIEPLKIISKDVVLGICKRLMSDFDGNRSGLPDLTIYNESTFLFAEVKSVNDTLSESQINWHEYLSGKLGCQVDICLINYTDRRVENLKNKRKKKSTDIKISFGSSTSKKRDEAIAFISKQSSFEEIGEGKDKIYSAFFTTLELDNLYTMLDLTKGWKSQKIEVRNKIVKSSVLRDALYCYKVKEQSNLSVKHCAQIENIGQNNIFGCQRFLFDGFSGTKWRSFGYVDTVNGEWCFDKSELKKALDIKAEELSLCPLFDIRKMNKALTKLPNRINPIEHKSWAFAGQDYSKWIWEKGDWYSSDGNKNGFPGYSLMIGIDAITSKERREIIRYCQDCERFDIDIDFTEGESIREQKSSCFVATVVYGSENSIEVQQLRLFRDSHLIKTVWGRVFVGIYYKLGPMLAFVIKKLPFLQKPIRQFIDILRLYIL